MSAEPILIDLIAILIVVYAWLTLPKGRLRWLFIVAFLLMAFYKMYDPSSEWVTLLWIRHLPVYIGEILFFIFITSFSRRYIELDETPTKPHQVVMKQSLLVLAPFIIFGTGVSWYQYVTDQGLPHILALPIFVLVLSLVRLRLAIYDNKYIPVVRLFTFAVGGWILIHVSEFLIESQKLFPKLDESMAHIEFFWYCVGAAIFVYALRAFKKVNHGQKV